MKDYGDLVGERLLCAMAEDIFELKMKIQDLQMDKRELEWETAKEIFAQERLDLLSINWRRLHSLAASKR